MASEPAEVTTLLHRMSAGDREAESRLFRVLYPDLRRMAARYMRGEKPGATLQPTALIAEAYLRLAGSDGVAWADRNHFLAVAASVMRHVLVDHARQRLAKKRGARPIAAEFDEQIAVSVGDPYQILCVHEALEHLTQLDPRQARIVELRYFGGLDIEETAAMLGVSARTVKREWTMARAWLRGKLASKTQ